MKIIPKTNLGQSTFQDTYFVAGAQLTPFRTLRQLELQIKEIESSLKKADINKRRTILKLEKLNPMDPMEALDIEEFVFDLEQQNALIVDAKTRLSNFIDIRTQLLDFTPQEYWDQGFEAAEEEHWQLHFAKQLAISQMTGIPDKHLAEQMMLLPDKMVGKIMELSNVQTNRFLLANSSSKL